MNTSDFAAIFGTLMSELVHGAPDTRTPTYMLNRGDVGLLGSLESLSSAAACASVNGGASIAAHVEHLRYGLSLVNAWAAGQPTPWANADWTRAWEIGPLTDVEWRALHDALREEATRWTTVLRTPRELTTGEATWMVGTIPHLAYHLGAIRQIDRATRGPTAEDEARVAAALAREAAGSP